MKKLILCAIFVTLALSTAAKSVGVYCFFSDTKTNIYEDDNVQLVGTYAEGKIHIGVINKSSKIIYIDKANSFIYINGTPISLFTNAVHTTGTTNSKGHSVNLGGIARGLGVGGSLATGLSAINVGGGSSVQNTTTIYEQRILAVAPLATEILYSIGDLRHQFDKDIVYAGEKPSFNNFSAGRHGMFVDQKTGKRTIFKIGDIRHYQQQESPLEAKAAITYSTNEQFNDSKLITISHYISDIVIDNKKGAKNNKKAAKANLPYCAPYIAKNMECHRFISGRNVGVPIAAVLTLEIAIVGGVAAIIAVCVAA